MLLGKALVPVEGLVMDFGSGKDSKIEKEASSKWNLVKAKARSLGWAKGIEALGLNKAVGSMFDSSMDNDLCC